MKPFNSFLVGLLAGATLGGIIALLYAPQTGKETREKIKLKIIDIEKELETLKRKRDNISERVKDDITTRLSELQREIEDLSAEVK